MFIRILVFMLLVCYSCGHDAVLDFLEQKPKIYEHKHLIKERTAENEVPLGIDKIDHYFNEFKSVSLLLFLNPQKSSLLFDFNFKFLGSWCIRSEKVSKTSYWSCQWRWTTITKIRNNFG